MSAYRARWFCPLDKRPKFRDFASKVKADKFAKLPRDFLVFVARLPIGHGDGGSDTTRYRRA